MKFRKNNKTIAIINDTLYPNGRDAQVMPTLCIGEDGWLVHVATFSTPGYAKMFADMLEEFTCKITVDKEGEGFEP